MVSEFAENGDLAHFLNNGHGPFSEVAARRHMLQMIRTVRMLHDAGAVHRDITPANVFVTAEGRLKLGDFGIAVHRVGRRDAVADAFNPGFAPKSHLDRRAKSWKRSDDVYHLGQVFAFLLNGRVERRLTPRDVKNFDCSAATKSVIQRCIGQREKRLPDAAAMLALLESHDAKPVRAASVRSLRGLNVVFTGGLTIPRSQAQRLLIRAGGKPQPRVNTQTDVVVVGDESPHWLAANKGQKLLDVDRENERGHGICLVGEKRFRALVRRR